MQSTPRPKNIQTFTCQGCGEEWTRVAVRGQRPRWCPNCRGKQMKPCGTCGKRSPIIRHTKNCDSCWGAIQQQRLERKLPAVYNGPKHPPRPTVHVRGGRRFISSQCRVCDKPFLSSYRESACSTHCHKLHVRNLRSLAKVRRAMRKRNAYVADVSRKKVFEADGYRCHICGRKTNPTKVAPHPTAPTIDHVIPLALGGTHEPLNTRTACFRCNSSKGHTGHGDQMLLIAI